MMYISIRPGYTEQTIPVSSVRRSKVSCETSPSISSGATENIAVSAIGTGFKVEKGWNFAANLLENDPVAATAAAFCVADVSVADNNEEEADEEEADKEVVE